MDQPEEPHEAEWTSHMDEPRGEPLVLKEAPDTRKKTSAERAPEKTKAEQAPDTKTEGDTQRVSISSDTSETSDSDSYSTSKST